MRDFDHSLAIEAPPTRILDAFFDAGDLASWWHVTRSRCLPRGLGSYAVGWPTQDWTDDVLGRLGVASRATVGEFKPGREFFVADAYSLPPDGEPIGPMALEASCTDLGGRAILRVRQSGWENSRRWTRYYEILAANFTASLGELKQYVESRP